MPSFRTRAKETEQAVGPLFLALAVVHPKFDYTTPNTHPIMAGQRVSDTRPLVGVRASSRAATTSVEAEASYATKEKAPKRAAAAKAGEKTAMAKAAAEKMAAAKAAEKMAAAKAAKVADKKLKAAEARAAADQAAALKTASKEAKAQLTAVGKEASAAKKQTKAAEKAAEKAQQESSKQQVVVASKYRAVKQVFRTHLHIYLLNCRRRRRHRRSWPRQKGSWQKVSEAPQSSRRAGAASLLTLRARRVSLFFNLAHNLNYAYYPKFNPYQLSPTHQYAGCQLAGCPAQGPVVTEL